MRKIDIQKSLRHLEKIRSLMSKARSPYKNMTKQQIIDEIRKTRQKLWEEKLVTHQPADALIAAYAEYVGAEILVSENRHFLSRQTNLPFKIVNAE